MYLIAHCIYIYTQTHQRKGAYGMSEDRCPLKHIYPHMKITLNINILRRMGHFR